MPDEMFDEAVQAVRAGQRSRAKDLLARLIKVDPEQPDYWLWMSAAVDSEKEQVFCLQNVLKLDPNSVAARRGLVVLGALRPEESGLPPANVLEDTRVAVPAVAAGSGLAGLLANRRGREMLAIGGVGALAVVVLVIACLAVLAPGLFRPSQVVVASAVPGPTRPAAPTATVPVAVAVVCNLPASSDPATPLAFYLCLTQTPTPLAVSTEASVAENYTSLKRYYHDLEWSSILTHAAAILADPNVPQSARVYFYLAEAYRHTGDLQNALKNYQVSVQKDNSFAPAYWGRALVEVTQNKRSAALADFDHAILADSSFVSSYLDRAAYNGLTGDAAAALTDLQQAQLVAPHNALVLASLGLALVENGQAARGMEQAMAALAIDPGMALGYFARGRAEYVQAAYAQADADLSLAYRYVLALDSPLPAQFQANVLAVTALAKAANNDPASALTLLSQAVGLDGSRPSLYLQRGALYLSAGRFEEARADYSAAVSQLEKTSPKDPALVVATIGLGRALLGLSRAPEAVTTFQSAIHLAPDNFAANLGLGQASLAAGQTDAAIAALTTALGLASGPADTAQAYFWRAAAYAAAGQPAAEVADLLAYSGLADSQDPLAATVAATVAARLTAIGPQPSITPTASTMPTATPRVSPTTRRSATATPTPSRTSIPTGTSLR